MNAPFHSWSPGTPPEELSAALFNGVLMVFSGLPSVARLVGRAKAIVEQVYGTADPEGAEAGMAPDRFRQAAACARKAVERDDAIYSDWRATLAAIGFDPAETHLDRIRLRVVPSRKEAHGRFIRPLPAHRDSWGSGIMAQINWWLPLYPASATRTMILWPAAFRRAVANSSAEWDFDALLQGGRKDYPLLPVATQVPAEPGLPVVIEPGALLAFSAAHLHGSAADDSGRSRISMDTRTVWSRDVLAGRGAANVDGSGRRAHWEWFTRPGMRPAAVQPPETVQDQGIVS